MKSHFRRIKMDVRVVFFSLVLFGILHVATLRSIDQIIEDAETDFEKNYTGPMSRLPSRVWYDYEVKGRSEELVKLQLDMIITKGVWDTIIDTEDALPSRAKRNAVKDKTKLWPRRIPYILNDDFDTSDKFKLVMAMDHWEEHTCLEFVEADETKDFDIIEFVPIPYGCESLLGRMQGRQPINLAPPCMYKEVIVHEIGHALGLYHEHMRADRDNHVTVNYQNIKETNHPQFDKLKADQFDGYDKPYDYESIMHYGKLFYSLNRTGNLITIEPKDAAYFDVIGEAPSLSFYDVKIVNEMYECSGGCEHKVCPGNGFLGKNCECYCTGKDAYEIVLCDRTENCGRPNISLSQYFVFTNFEHEITSWDEEAEFYPHGTHFILEHKNESCGYNTATFNCSDGQWEGELLPCEKACLVGKFGDDYIIKRGDEIMEPGDEVLSAHGVYVSCKNSRKGTDNPDEYIACSDGEWLRNISDMICIKENCGRPNISLSQYFVFTNNLEHEITFWDEEAEFYPHGTHFIMEHKDESCGYNTATFNCSDGQWEGELLPCEKACLVGQFSDDYVIKRGNEIIEPGDEVLSADGVYVSCRNSRKGTDNPDEYIACSDGEWLRNISDMICIKEHPLCPMVVNSQLTGSFDDGFSVTCLEGYEIETEGEPVSSFRCTLAGEWEPFTPVCNPAHCTIPLSKNSTGQLLSQNGDEVLRGSEITHGSDVTLICPRGHIPEPVTISCQYGQWDRKVPECILVTCPEPLVVDAKYRPQQDVYIYGDSVKVGRCKGILSLEGSRDLQCNKFGSWTGSAVCKPFCDDGVLKFDTMKNKEFRDGVWHKKVGLSSFAACEKKCRRYKRFLCLSFAFGVKNGRHFCHLHPQNPAEMPERVQTRSFYTIGVRQCIRN